MTELHHLIVDLRAHAHEVPEPIGKLMREAAAALDNCSGFVAIANDLRLTDEPLPPPFSPPKEQVDAHR